MKKSFLSFIVCIVYITAIAQTICTDSSKIKFSGKAPAPWAINGQVNDWETILGPGTGNPASPYNPPATSSFNFFNETVEFDQPEPSRDLRFFSFTHDDYNVYFYFRRLQNGNGQNTFFYFCDINADGYMNTGEPVFSASFNSKNISSLSIGSYIANTSIDYFTNKGNYMVRPPQVLNNPFYPTYCSANGYSMQGGVDEIFNSSSIPAVNVLNPSEVFAASITEDGFGVEFAVPWKYFKNWVSNSTPLDPVANREIFTYHIALMNGGGKYHSSKVMDNAGGCHHQTFISNTGNDLAISGSPDFQLQNSSVTTITPGSSYRIQLQYQNTTNAEEIFFFRSATFKNIQATPGKAIDERAFSVNIGFDLNCDGVINNGELTFPLNYVSGSFNQQPISYFNLNVMVPIVQGGHSICMIINVSFPPDNSVQSCEIEFQPRASFTILSECELLGSALSGGKPINPIGFILESEPAAISRYIRSEQTDVDKSGVYIYPNPSSGTTNVILPPDWNTTEIAITDYSGKLIRKLRSVKQRIIRIENLKSGFYLLNLRSADGKNQATGKIIVY